jgi:hypothetical protein
MAKSAISQLMSDIKRLGARTSKWRDDVQVILVRCAGFAFEGNADPFNHLLEQMTGADLAAIVKWAETNTPVMFRKSESDGVKRFGINKSFEGVYDATELLGLPWWQHAKKPQQVSSVYDVAEAVRELIKRAEREVEAGKKTVQHADLIRDLKALAGRVSAAETE